MNPIAKYLMCSYLYYECDKSAISDGEFDELCKDLLVNLDKYEHKHKHLIIKGNLHAGTCLGIKYPEHCKSAALRWYKKLIKENPDYILVS